jgi:hypothetical protein
MSSTIKNSIISKLVWTVLGFIALYVAAAAFNLVPKSMTDFVAYLQKNTALFIFALCFIIGAYVVLKIKTNRREA